MNILSVLLVLFYLAWGALFHWIFWGTAWFGVASFALIVLWPFFLFFWFLIIALGLVIVIGIVVFVINMFAERERYSHRRNRSRHNR